MPHNDTSLSQAASRDRTFAHARRALQKIFKAHPAATLEPLLDRIDLAGKLNIDTLVNVIPQIAFDILKDLDDPKVRRKIETTYSAAGTLIAHVILNDSKIQAFVSQQTHKNAFQTQAAQIDEAHRLMKVSIKEEKDWETIGFKFADQDIFSEALASIMRQLTDKGKALWEEGQFAAHSNDYVALNHVPAERRGCQSGQTFR